MLTDGSPEEGHLLSIWTTRTGLPATVAGHDLHTSYHNDGRRHVTGAPARDEHGRRLYPPVKITQETPGVDVISDCDKEVIVHRSDGRRRVARNSR